MRKSVIPKIYLYLLAVLCQAVVLTSCSHDKEQPDGAEQERLKLTFHLISSETYSGSRSDLHGHEEADSELSTLEDALIPSESIMMVFAKEEGSSQSEKMLFKSVGFTSSGSEGVEVIGMSGNYTVTLSMSKKVLNERLGFSSLPSDSQKIQFRILIISGAAPYGTSEEDMWKTISDTDDLPTVLAALDKLPYSISSLYDSSDARESEEMPTAVGLYGNRKKALPMFGLGSFAITYGTLFSSRPYDWIYLGEINMLRSLAKVRVVDNIAKNNEGLPMIVKAEFVGSRDKAKLIPYGAYGYVNGSQVNFANIWSNGGGSEDEAEMELGVVGDSDNMTPETQRTGYTRIGYAPEQRIGEDERDYPKFRITVLLQKNSDGSGFTQVYEVPFSGYNTTTLNFGTSLLRNHVYTLSVEGVNDADVAADIYIDSWDRYRNHIEI